MDPFVYSTIEAYDLLDRIFFWAGSVFLRYMQMIIIRILCWESILLSLQEENQFLPTQTPCQEYKINLDLCPWL